MVACLERGFVLGELLVFGLIVVILCQLSQAFLRPSFGQLLLLSLLHFRRLRCRLPEARFAYAVAPTRNILRRVGRLHQIEFRPRPTQLNHRLLPTCVAIHQVLPAGSFTPPRRSGSPGFCFGSSTETPPAARARL